MPPEVWLRFQELRERNIPSEAAPVIAADPRAKASTIDTIVETYLYVRSHDIPWHPAAIIASSQGTFRYVNNGYSRVIATYRRLMEEGDEPAEAAINSIF